MLTVNDDPARVERRLAAGGLGCPDCGEVLAGWGYARLRLIRDESGGRWMVRPRRARCGGCAATHVLLPVGVLLRRADTVAVIGKALLCMASGGGARSAAAVVDRPLETVRGWLRRFASRAEAVRVWFTRLLVAVAVDPVPPDPAGSLRADAIAAMRAAAQAVAARFSMTTVTRWQIVGAVSGGRLLSPDWPPEWINTSSPWLAAM